MRSDCWGQPSRCPIGGGPVKTSSHWPRWSGLGHATQGAGEDQIIPYPSAVVTHPLTMADKTGRISFCTYFSSKLPGYDH